MPSDRIAASRSVAAASGATRAARHIASASAVSRRGSAGATVRRATAIGSELGEAAIFPGPVHGDMRDPQADRQVDRDQHDQRDEPRPQGVEPFAEQE